MEQSISTQLRHLKPVVFLTLAAIWGHIFTGCSTQDDPYLLEVNGQKLTVAEFSDQFKSSEVYKSAEVVSSQQIRNYAETHFVNNLLFQAEGFRRQLDKDSLALQELNRRKKNILIKPDGVLFHSIIPEEIRVSEKELENFYNSQRTEVRVAHLLTMSGQFADSLHKLAAGSTDFGKLAATYSVDVESAANGGQISGYLCWGDRNEKFMRAALQLRRNQVSEPVRTSDGYHIIKLLEKRFRTQKPFEESRDTLIQQIRALKKRQFLASYSARLFQNYRFAMAAATVPFILESYQEQEGDRILVAEKVSGNQFKQTICMTSVDKVTVQELMTAYNALPLEERPRLLLPEDVEAFAKHLMLPDLMFLDARDRNLELDWKYFEEIKKIKQQYVQQACRYLMVDSKIQISEPELKTRYESEKERFQEIEFAEAASILRDEIRQQKAAELAESTVQELSAYYNIRFNPGVVHALAEQLNREKLQ